MSEEKLRRFPAEVVGGTSLAILAFSGSLKSNSLLAWIPGDLTFATAAIVLLSVCVLGLRQLNEGRGTFRPFFPLLLWTLFLLPTALSPTTEYATTKVTMLFTVTFLCAIAPYTVLRERRGQYSFLTTLLLIGLLAAGGALFGSGNYANDYSNRLMFEGSTTITTAQMIGLGVILGFLSLFTEAPKILRMLLSVLSPFLLLIGLFTGSRGPVISVIISVLIVLLFSKRLRKNRFARLFAGVTIIGIIFYQAIRIGSDGTERILSFVTGDDSSQGSGRTPLYSYALSIIQEHPLGIGWGGYQKYGFEYPHNFFLEIFGEAGIVIGMILTIAMVVAFILLYKRSTDVVGTAFLSLYCFAFFNAMFSSDMNGNKLLWTMLFVAFVNGARHSQETCRGQDDPYQLSDPSSEKSYHQVISAEESRRDISKRRRYSANYSRKKKLKLQERFQ